MSSSSGETCIASNTTLSYAVRGTVISMYCTVTISFNFLQILVTQRVASFSDNTRILMTSLALSDLGVGLLAVFSLISVFIKTTLFPGWFCYVVFALFYTFTSRSVLDLMLLTVDRFIAVIKPLHYPTILPQSRVKLITIILWVVIIICGVVTSLVNTVVFNDCVALCLPKLPRAVIDSVVICILYYVWPVLVIFGMNLKLCQVSCTHARRIRAMVSVPDAGQHGVPPLPARRIHRRLIHGKAVSVVFFVTLGFAVTWLAYYVVILLSAFGGHEASEWIQFTVVWLALSNSWLNVIIYALLNRAFRETASKFLLRCMHCLHLRPWTESWLN